jgi:hypothetical protein
MPSPPPEPEIPNWNDEERRRRRNIHHAPLLPPPPGTELIGYGEDLAEETRKFKTLIDETFYMVVERATEGKVSRRQLKELDEEATPLALLKNIFGRAATEVIKRSFVSPTAPGADTVEPPRQELTARRLDQLTEAIASATRAAAGRLTRLHSELLRGELFRKLGDVLDPQLIDELVAMLPPDP